MINKTKNTNTVESLTWEQNFEFFKKYVTAKGMNSVTSKTSIEIENGNEIRIGTWYFHQKKLFNQSKLKDERQKLMVTFNASIFKGANSTWTESFEVFKRASKENKNIVYNTVFVDESGKSHKVGQWVKNQRMFFRTGKKQLSPIQIRKIKKFSPSFFDK